jgi:hypothetical protein
MKLLYVVGAFTREEVIQNIYDFSFQKTGEMKVADAFTSPGKTLSKFFEEGIRETLLIASDGVVWVNATVMGRWYSGDEESFASLIHRGKLVFTT